jgi:hypothetical protein
MISVKDGNDLFCNGSDIPDTKRDWLIDWLIDDDDDDDDDGDGDEAFTSIKIVLGI